MTGTRSIPNTSRSSTTSETTSTWRDGPLGRVRAPVSRSIEGQHAHAGSLGDERVRQNKRGPGVPWITTTGVPSSGPTRRPVTLCRRRARSHDLCSACNSDGCPRSCVPYRLSAPPSRYRTCLLATWWSGRAAAVESESLQRRQTAKPSYGYRACCSSTHVGPQSVTRPPGRARPHAAPIFHSTPLGRAGSLSVADADGDGPVPMSENAQSANLRFHVIRREG